MSTSRFQIVHSDADQPWHARIRAGNSRKWWATETYQRRRSALAAAVNLVVDLAQPDSYRLVDTGLILTKGGDTWTVEIHDVDERA